MTVTDFNPRGLLRNPHVQSILASSGVRRFVLRHKREALERDSIEHILDAGDGIRLQGFHTRQQVLERPRALAILLHGWEGSAQSSYVLNTASRLLEDGCDVFRLNLRDHGDTHHLNPELFHSCRIDEVVGAVKHIAQLFNERPLVIGGYSLGGNFALRVALRAPAAGIPLTWTFAVCPVISPHAGLASIENAPWIYEHYFMIKWRASLRRKQALFPQQELFSKDELRGNMRELTRNMVLRHTDFGSLENYLDGYSIAGDTLSALHVPASILTAADDPVIPVAEFRALRLAPTTDLTIVEHGGHCAFIADWSLHSWAEDFVISHLERAIGAREDAEIGVAASGAA
ncbi:MAG: alpha/beta fold hydrolase [Rudaea sp.]